VEEKTGRMTVLAADLSGDVAGERETHPAPIFREKPQLYEDL